MIVNLVGNALKFTDEGEVFLNVWVDYQDETAIEVHFLIRDTGIGIPPEKQEKIFESFAQADASTTRRFGGTGLGLAISSQLVGLMQGQVWVESEVNQGSTFHFTARFGRPGTAAHAVCQLPPLVAPQADQCHVLVVDEHATRRHAYEEHLRRMRASVSTAASAEQAIQLICHGTNQPPTLHAVIVSGGATAQRSASRLAKLISSAANTQHLPLLLISPPGDAQLGIDTTAWRRSTLATGPLHAAALHQLVAELLAKDSPQGTTAAVATACQPVRPLQILLAEDCEVNREVAIGLLDLRGHHVTVAGNGQAAVQQLASDSFDVVLMDVEMPVMDGLEATRQIRAAEQADGSYTPIIAMTAHATAQIERNCREAGMDAYVTKPIDAQKLYQVVESLAAGSPRGEESKV